MKWILLFLLAINAGSLGAQEAVPSPTQVLKLMSPWDGAKAPWDEWFKKNTTATDKTDYVYIFWDANDFKGNFEVKDKKRRLAEAALQLVKRLYPSDATADLVKLDIGYILEKDSYGLPKWDSLQKVAHLEFLKSKILKQGKSPVKLSEAVIKKMFDKFEIY